MSLLANRYARALFDAAQSSDAIDAVAGDLTTVARALADPVIRAVVLEPDTPVATRRRALEKLAENFHQLTKNLVQMLLARRRQALLTCLQPAFRRLVMEAAGEVDGLLESAAPLSEDTLRAVTSTAAALSGKTVVLTVRENPDLIGGVRLRIGNTLYDSSVATAIEELERALMSAPIP